MEADQAASRPQPQQQQHLPTTTTVSTTRPPTSTSTACPTLCYTAPGSAVVQICVMSQNKMHICSVPLVKKYYYVQSFQNNILFNMPENIDVYCLFENI